MSQEVVVRYRDDLDNELGDDIETREFGWLGTRYEIDLRPANFELFAADMKRWLERSRPVRKKSYKKRQPSVHAAEAKTAKPVAWSSQIAGWAAEHGLNWSDKQVRDQVRQWAFDTGHQCSTTGIIPRPTMEAYVAALPPS